MSSPVLSREEGLRVHPIRMVGTGASAPTKVYGRNVTIAYSSAGIYTVTWSSSQPPGTFVNAVASLAATTASGLKNFSLILSDYDTTNLRLTLTLYNAAGTLTDLTSAQWISLNVTFKAVSV